MSIEDIKKLREATGAGMMDAKVALEEANGDFEPMILKSFVATLQCRSQPPVQPI